jgi:hypothetical protein
MLMSNAVPRRRGTIGVNSNATRGCCVTDDVLESASDVRSPEGFWSPECAADISNASIRPGEITIEHSSGYICSQEPLSDHAQTIAIVLNVELLAMLFEDGTLRYGPCEAESEGASVRVPLVEAGVGCCVCIWTAFDNFLLAPVTATSGVCMSCTSDMKSCEVSEDESDISSLAESDDDSDAVEGAYSRFNGDDDRLFLPLSGLGLGFSTGSEGFGRDCLVMLLRSRCGGGAGGPAASGCVPGC